MAKTLNYKRRFIKGFIALAITTGVTVSPNLVDNYSYAAERNETYSTGNSSGKIVKVNDHTARIDLNQNVTYDIDKNGIASLRNENTGDIEKLPSIAKDRNGNNISLVYFEDNGDLGVYAQNMYQDRGIGKCISGIAGGAVTGGTTLGLAGDGVGTVTLPIVGTVGGGVVGAVGGAVGGGLTGGATFC